ncbi:putative RNA-binding protein [Desulfosporosinus acididurans]|uniref:Putative RNA-binding protein n=1 Tax=Desulfosporosinus acididurans TaxID=476652 RepID=A0A0J1IM27_9FIRM|nr:CooT family nickel-binding protein [Desulfosporosinus acididurans]KLU65761.1 putative RNA-binding protein [Desulfosporosinus acididurans]
MCETNVYIRTGDDQEELFLEQVDIIEPSEAGLRLVDIFGKQRFINARIKDMNLLNHRIVLEKLQTIAAKKCINGSKV